MYPTSIQKLIDLFSKFPTVGPRTATRFVFYLLKLSNEEIKNLVSSIFDLKEKIKTCKFCFNFFEPSKKTQELCQICSDPTRNRNLLCIVEKEADFVAIEKTKKYHGIYFILGGVISTLKKNEIEKIRLKELKERLQNPAKFGLSDATFTEIIIATNFTPEAEATALYLERFLKPFNKKITRLGRGLPVGGELEYADEETIKSAFETRR